MNSEIEHFHDGRYCMAQLSDAAFMVSQEHLEWYESPPEVVVLYGELQCVTSSVRHILRQSYFTRHRCDTRFVWGLGPKEGVPSVNLERVFDSVCGGEREALPVGV